MKIFNHLIYIFAVTSFSFASIPDVEIFISGPKLNYKDLCEQIENRSTLRVASNVKFPDNLMFKLNGLTNLRNIVKEIRDSYLSLHKENLNIQFSENKIFIQEQSSNIIKPENEDSNRGNSNLDNKDSLRNNTQQDEILIEDIPLAYNATNLSDLTASNIPTDNDSRQPPEENKKNKAQQYKDISKNTEQTPTVLKTEAPQNNTLKKRPSNYYILKPGDEIEISVWGEDMDRTLTVRPDGFISYILIGELSVVGKTFPELKKIIEKKLSEYIIAPNVSIIGKSFEGNFVSILGAVSKPGRKVVSTTDRILDVLTKAGGLKFEEFGGNGGEVANLKGAYLSRSGELVNVDFEKLVYEGDMTQNVPVFINDFIYIPSSVGVPIYITGEVNRPTSLPYRGRPTLIDGITSAAGFNISANKSNIKVVRGHLKDPTVFTYNYSKIISGKIPNPYLEPGDIIYIPPTTITKIERISTKIIPFLNTIIDSGRAKDTIRDW